MATAKKLPSGSWRCQIYSHTDASGKRHYKSFTNSDPSPKGKRKCEAEAAAWAAQKEMYSKIPEIERMTIKDAIAKYIKLKEPVLSPATIRGYKQMQKSYADIDHIVISDLTHDDIQQWINTYSATHSPKSVSNAHGLLAATLYHYDIEITKKSRLPQKKLPDFYVPSDNDVVRILNYFRDQHDTDMVNAILLAAYGPLRRSEICGLDASDINGNIIHVHDAVVKNDKHRFVEKGTKNLSSDRFIDFPSFVIDALPKEGKIVNLQPDIITNRFVRGIDRSGVHPFRFHDLRHYCASVMHAIGVPDVYIMQRGGWKTDSVLKRIYRGSIEDYKKKFIVMTNSHFENMQHEMQHDF